MLAVHSGTKIPTDWKGLTYVNYDSSSDSGGGKATVDGVCTQARDMIDRLGLKRFEHLEYQVMGYWWQFVINQKDGAVLSLMEISSAQDYAKWKVSGRAWTGDGENTAKYWSRAVAFDVRDKKLFYYWEGEFPFDPSIPRFFGAGEIQFDDPDRGIISKADGWYSETPLANLDATVRKSTLYMRASKEDVQIMKGNDRTAIKKLVNARAKEWRKMYA